MLVKADVSFVGPKGSVSGTALVDAGASITLLDEEVADKIGARLVGRRTRLVVTDGHEVSGELAIVDRLVIDGEELPGAHVVVLRLPSKIKERLKAHGLSDWCIVGLSALEILGLAANVAEGRVEKVGSLLLAAVDALSCLQMTVLKHQRPASREVRRERHCSKMLRPLLESERQAPRGSHLALGRGLRPTATD